MSHFYAEVNQVALNYGLSYLSWHEQSKWLQGLSLFQLHPSANSFCICATKQLLRTDAKVWFSLQVGLKTPAPALWDPQPSSPSPCSTSSPPPSRGASWSEATTASSYNSRASPTTPAALVEQNLSSRSKLSSQIRIFQHFLFRERQKFGSSSWSWTARWSWRSWRGWRSSPPAWASRTSPPPFRARSWQGWTVSTFLQAQRATRTPLDLVRGKGCKECWM